MVNMYINIEWGIHYAALCHYDEKYGTCNFLQSEDYESYLPGLGENEGVYSKTS